VNKIKFVSNYIKEYCEKIVSAETQKNKIVSVCNLLTKVKAKNSIHIFGNGGSASIASHFSMDLTNNSNLRCLSYNDPAIITCYANDFKFENWISRVITKYGKSNDILILISSSGTSKNMINGLKVAKKKKFDKIISFTGFKKENYLSKNSDINFWIDSKKYNIIENAHQFYLLMIVDLIKKLKQ
jgi:D-sedoheptulose 7-phosphate isomerase